MPTLQQKAKPPRGTVARGLVAPEWRWAWRGLQKALLFNEGSGGVYDHVRHDVASLNGTSVWRMGIPGLGVECDGAGESISLPSAGLDAGRGSLAISITRTAPDKHATCKLCCVTDAQFQLYRNNLDTSIDLKINNTAGVFTTPNLWDGKNHILVATWDATLNVRKLWVDGVLMGTVVVGFGVPGLDATLYLLNRLDGARDAGMTIHLFALWDTVLTEDNAVALSRDPFGPLRPWRPTAGFVAAAPPPPAVGDAFGETGEAVGVTHIRPTRVLSY